jgi:D-alanyl-D-alanine carboxypeptidase
MLLVIPAGVDYSWAKGKSKRRIRSESSLKKSLVNKKKSPVKKRTLSRSKRRHKRARRRGIQAKALYCVDVKNKRTVLAKNADRTLPIASLTKLVTAMVALDKYGISKKLRVPKYIRKVPRSRVGLRPGDRVSVRDLLHGLLMQSGNDCAETLAAAYPGGRYKFIRAMNIKARMLGAKRTRFYTPSGLDSRRVLKKKGKRKVRIRSNVSTAREIARLAKAAFDYKTIRKITQKRYFRMKSRRLKRGYRVVTTNKLLRGPLPILGAKTGYTSRAGRCLATEFTPGDKKLLIVVLGSRNHFRDTRLLYKAALKKTHKSGKRSRSGPKPAKKRKRLAQAGSWGS